jgi:hypothetical protein
MPVFALFNTGVALGGSGDGGIGAVSLGAFLGLVVGKPLGVTATAWLAMRLRLAPFRKGRVGARGSASGSWPGLASPCRFHRRPRVRRHPAPGCGQARGAFGIDRRRDRRCDPSLWDAGQADGVAASSRPPRPSGRLRRSSGFTNRLFVRRRAEQLASASLIAARTAPTHCGATPLKAAPGRSALRTWTECKRRGR